MSQPRWTKLDQWQALAAESYWAELCKLPHKDKAALVATLAASNKSRDLILEYSYSLSLDRSMAKAFAERPAATVQYEVAMRTASYEAMSTAELDCLAAEAIEQDKVLQSLLLAAIKSAIV